MAGWGSSITIQHSLAHDLSFARGVCAIYRELDSFLGYLVLIYHILHSMVYGKLNHFPSKKEKHTTIEVKLLTYLLYKLFTSYLWEEVVLNW